MSDQIDIGRPLAFQRDERALRILDDRFVARIVEQRHAPVRRRSPEKAHRVATSVVFNGGDPGCCALGVAGRVYGAKSRSPSETVSPFFSTRATLTGSQPMAPSAELSFPVESASAS